jgi:hypothetical protein
VLQHAARKPQLGCCSMQQANRNLGTAACSKETATWVLQQAASKPQLGYCSMQQGNYSAVVHWNMHREVRNTCLATTHHHNDIL